MASPKKTPSYQSNTLLTGDRVFLRALELDDAPLLLRANNDPEIRKTFFTNLPTNLPDQEERIRRLYEDKANILLAICAADSDGRAIGITGYHRIDWVGRMATFSLIIADPEAWGHGYGSESTRLMVQYGFDILNFHRIQLHVYAGNNAAIHIYKKVGFREEGLLREAMVQDGKYRDFLVMGMLESEWRDK
jgi:RimJ/RimL family protein N-acetyltransferase